MPIYAYKCASCGFTKDALQKMSDPPLTDCPNCGQPALQKQVTAAGFQLKGSGWYVTDFRDGGKGPTAKDQKADSSAAAPAADSPAPSPAAAPASGTAAPAPAPAPAASTPSPAPSSSGGGTQSKD